MWLILFLLFPLWAYAAEPEIDPIVDSIDGDGKIAVLSPGKTEVNAIPIKADNNVATLSIDRAVYTDPTQIITVEIWSLIDSVWQQVCAADTFGDAKTKQLTTLKCGLRGGTEAKGYVNVGKSNLATKVFLDTVTVAKPDFIAPLHHSVAYDTSDSATASTVSSVTISGYTAAATNPGLFCGVSFSNEGVVTSGVTFNSVAMTKVGQATATKDLTAWRLVGQSGSHDAVASFTSGTADSAVIVCSSFTGVDQTTPEETATIATTTGPYAVTVPTNGMGLDYKADVSGLTGAACVFNNAPQEAGQTERVEDCDSSSGSTNIASSTRDTTGNFDWLSDGGYDLHITIPIRAQGTATAAVTRRRNQ